MYTSRLIAIKAQNSESVLWESPIPEISIKMGLGSASKFFSMGFSVSVCMINREKFLSFLLAASTLVSVCFKHLLTKFFSVGRVPGALLCFVCSGVFSSCSQAFFSVLPVTFNSVPSLGLAIVRAPDRCSSDIATFAQASIDFPEAGIPVLVG